MTEQAVANTVEYNKIHALARARKVVISKFGSNLMSFWPMADDSTFIRDLLRQHPLVAKGSPIFATSGMIDYAIQLPSGSYASDVTPDKEFSGSATSGYTDRSVKPVAGADLPVGLWRGLHLHNFNAISTGTVTVTVWLAPANTSPSQLDSQCLAKAQYSQAVTYGEWYAFDILFDNPMVVTTAGYWMYVDWNLSGNLRWFNCNSPIENQYWTGSAWSTISGQRVMWMTALGQSDALVYPALDQFCVGLWANVDDKDAKNGALFTLASSENKARIFITSAKKAEGYVKTSGGTAQTLTTPTRFHPGFNLITLSYDRNVVNEGLKLGVNGKVVAKATSPDEALFNATLTLTVGGVPDCIVDDVFMAKDVPTDAELWDIYLSYITAAPLMTVESVTVA